MALPVRAPFNVYGYEMLLCDDVSKTVVFERRKNEILPFRGVKQNRQIRVTRTCVSGSIRPRVSADTPAALSASRRHSAITLIVSKQHSSTADHAARRSRPALPSRRSHPERRLDTSRAATPASGESRAVGTRYSVSVTESRGSASESMHCNAESARRPLSQSSHTGQVCGVAMPVFGVSIASSEQATYSSANTAPYSRQQCIPQPSSAGRAARWVLCVSLCALLPTMRSPHMGTNLTRHALHRLGPACLRFDASLPLLERIGTMERREFQCDQCRGKGKRGSAGRGAAWRGGWPLRFVVWRWARRCQP